MSTAELKSTLHKLIVETDDVNILSKIKEVFYALKSDQVDWADLISDNEKKMIDAGLKDANEGKLISHDQVRKRIYKWFDEKRKMNG